VQRAAIIGTAETFAEVPWQDTDLMLMGLNDCYALGWQRPPDVWFDQHELDAFVYRKKHQAVKIRPEDLPPGRHLRPEGHLEWLRQQSQRIPVVLQHDPPPGWGPHAQRYPLEAIQEKYRKVLRTDPTWPKDYATSGPAWMLLWALSQGVSELHIYGIHLATEKEYLDQRPNFEMLIGYALGQGVEVVLPKTTPICKAREVYCYEPRFSQAAAPVQSTLAAVNSERAKLTKALATRKWYQPARRMREALRQQDVKRLDCEQQLSRLWMMDQVRSPEWRVV